MFSATVSGFSGATQLSVDADEVNSCESAAKDDYFVYDLGIGQTIVNVTVYLSSPGKLIVYANVYEGGICYDGNNHDELAAGELHTLTCNKGSRYFRIKSIGNGTTDICDVKFYNGR